MIANRVRIVGTEIYTNEMKILIKTTHYENLPMKYTETFFQQ